MAARIYMFNIPANNQHKKEILVFKYTFSGPRPRMRENNLKYVFKRFDKCLFGRSIDLFTNHRNININADMICMVMLFWLIQADIDSIKK